MFKKLVLVVALLVSLVGSIGAAPKAVKPTRSQFINNILLPATFEIYTPVDLKGELEPICTMTSFLHSPKGYFFITAAHCVIDKGRVNPYLALWKGELKLALRLVVLGDERKGEDFAVLYAETNAVIPTIKLGSDPKLYGEPILNLAAPQGLGLQIFQGIVSQPVMAEAKSDTDDWTGYMLVQLPASGGSSGSAIVCENQQAICGVLVGSVNGYSVAAPISHFRSLMEREMKK